MLIFKFIGGLLGEPVLWVKCLIGGRKNCLNFEYLTEFRPHQPWATGFRRDEILLFYDKCERWKAVFGAQGITFHLKTPEEKEACMRDFLRLIEEAKLQRDKEARVSAPHDPLGYLLAKSTAHNVHIFNTAIERFQEQFEAVRACQLERVVVEGSITNPHSSQEKWTLINKNKVPIYVSFETWRDQAKKDEPLKFLSCYEGLSTPIESVGLAQVKSRILHENAGLILEQIDCTPYPNAERVAILVKMDDGRLEELPLT